MAYANPSQGGPSVRKAQIPTPSAATMTNVLGAAVSLSLVVGVGYWGYNLIMRDVTGIPVVRAVEGDMRVRPDDPGGQAARHQGLAVNAVAATGQAEGPVDQVALAPSPVELTGEDVPVQPIIAEVETVQPTPEVSVTPEPRLADQEAVAEAIQNGNVQDLVNELTAGVEPIAPVTAAPEAEVVAETTELRTPEPEVVPVTAAGVTRSLHPVARPKTLRNVQSTSAAVTAALTDALPSEIDPATIPAGTRLVQLGAFDSADVARREWDSLQAKFPEYLDGKSRVVQKAQSGGNTFYRLRAMGFADLSESRRFCSALLAGKADCIPVQAR